MRTLMKTLAILAVFVTIAHSQSYNDVMVLVNSNSQISIDVANYFKSARGIPNVNICSFAMPTTEEITGAEFTSIMNSIKSYMSANGLTTTINYIVTTQGVPLKVRRAKSVFPPAGDPYSDASSFDSDLCLMNSDRETYIGNSGYIANPYYGSATSFSRTSTFRNIYLVTRLAGYSYSDIGNLISKAVQPYVSSGEFVFDRDPSKSAYSIDQNMANAYNTVTGKGFNAILNNTAEYVTDLTHVLGYVSWGSNDAYWYNYTQKANPNISFSAKALAETYVSSSGRSFADSTFIEPTIGWQSMVADLIGPKGVTGVKGYVYEPYTMAMANVNNLFNRWLSGSNLAESFYSSSYCLGWMDVVIGDPKSLFAAQGHLPVELTAFSGYFTEKKVKLEWRTATETNNYGFEVEKQDGSNWMTLGFVDGHGTSNSPQKYTFTDDNPQVENVYRLKQIDRDGKFEYSQIINVAGSAVTGFALNQNYPNPFNPQTAISFTLPAEASVTVQVYSLDGRLIRTLAQNMQHTPGTHTLIWDGKDANMQHSPTGSYFYRMSASVNGEVIYNDVKQMRLMK